MTFFPAAGRLDARCPLRDDRRVQILRIVLFGSAGFLSLALLAAWIPEAWMDRGHQALGLGPKPDSPVYEYLARSIALLYGFHGVLTFLVARDLRRYLTIVRYVGSVNVCFGVAVTAIDIEAGMPAIWAWMEGPPTAAVGLLILILAREPRSVDV